jgi:prepilin-type N-terminal cleavage/methylation domain-containing protein
MIGAAGQWWGRDRPGAHARSGAQASGRRHRPNRPPRSGEEGFTLIELLVVLVILPLITGAIAMVLITTLKNQQGIQGKVTDASAATTASAYYVRDIESAASVTTTGTPASSPQQCSASGLIGSKFILGLQLQGVGAVVSYYTVTPATGAPTELLRLYCLSGSPSSKVVLSDNVSATNPPTPVVNCITPLPTGIPTGVTCNPGSDWTFTYMVSTVTLNVTQGCSTAGPACAPYQYALTGAPVSGIPVPPLVPPNGVLTLLGTGTDISFTNFSSGQDICAVGSILLGSGYNSSGNNPAISSGPLTGNNSVTAGTTTSCATQQSNGIEIYNCLNDSSTGQLCPTSGTHDSVTGNVSVNPNPVSTSTKVTDPLATWASQNPVAAITTPIGSCSGSSTMTCSPGLYASGLNIPSNRTVNFQPGNYQFGTNTGCQSSLCIGSSDTVNFGTGHYTFTDGFNVSGSGSALCGGGTTSSVCPSPPSGGVFFYVSGGSTNLGNVNFANNIQLAPISTPSDPYHGVLLWQNGTDNNPVFLASAATTVNTYQGKIYVPNATISLYGFGNNISTGDIVANSMLFDFSFNLDVTIQ